MKVSMQQQIWTDFCCSKQTDSFLLENFDFSCFWADVPFRGFVLHDAQARWPMAQVSAAYAASTCTRSLRLSWRSTPQVTWRPVKHRLIESCLIYLTCKQKQRFCWLPSVSDQLETEDLKNIWSEIEMIKCHLYWIVRSESETKLPQCGSNFTRSWLPWLPCEVKGASAGWWALKCIEYIKSLYAKLPKKKLTDAPFQGFVTKLEHQPAKYRKGKKSLVCLECWHGVFCVWMRD